MQTKLGRLTALVAVLFVGILALEVRGQGTFVSPQFTISIYSVAMPYPPPASLSADVVNHVANGNVWACPGYFTNGATVPLQTIFNRNGGTNNGVMTYPLSIKSTTPFLLSDIVWGIWDPIFGLSSGTFSSFTGRGYGKDAGPDGILGTGDEVTYSTGNVNTPIYEAYLKGAGSTIDLGNSTIEQGLVTYAALTHEEGSLTFGGITIRTTLYYAAPEPSSITLLVLGLAGCLLKKRKK